MKRKYDLRLRLLYLAGIVSAVIICIILLPRSSDLLLGEGKIPMQNEDKLALSEKIAPESGSTFLDDELYGRHAYFCSADNCSVIAEKDSDIKAAPASLTKIMTAAVILENADDLDAQVTVSVDV